MARGLHPAIEAELRSGKGQVGVIRTMDSYARLGWEIVYPGDWLVNRGEHWERVAKDEFEVRFRAV